MSVHRQLVRLEDLAIPREMVLRLLAGRKARRQPRPALEVAITDALETAAELVAPRGVLGFSHQGLPGASSLTHTGPLVLAVGTIGPVLEERTAELAQRGEVGRSCILDAVGSAAAEAVADRLNGLICALAAATDLVPRRRASPGYGGFKLADQAAIFAALQPAEIGVTLTDRLMMVPRKSVSFVVPLASYQPGELAADPGGGDQVGRGSGREVPPARDRLAGHSASDGEARRRAAQAEAARRCSICGLPDCPYRDLPLGRPAAVNESVWQALLARGGFDG